MRLIIVLVILVSFGLSFTVQNETLMSPAKTGAAEHCTPSPIVCPERVHFGAATEALPKNMAPLTVFESSIGATSDVALTYTSFIYPFDNSGLQALIDSGRMPMITWEPWNPHKPRTNPFPLKSITAGAFDLYLSAQARRTKRLTGTVAIRFAHEMNADWYPWGQRVGGNSPNDYVAAFRHVHDLFVDEGVTNVVWTWSPNVINRHADASLGALYPGSRYVDWVGLTGYLDTPSTTYAKVYDSTLVELNALAPTTPIYIAETAVAPGRNREVAIRDLIRGVLTTPRVIGVNWFDIKARFDWRLDNDPVSGAALGKEIRRGWFTAATPSQPAAMAPLSQQPPIAHGEARVGSTFSANQGVWRENPAGGTLELAGAWFRCGTPTSAASCVHTEHTGSCYTLTRADAGMFVKYRVTATNRVGSATIWSAISEKIA